MAHRNHFTPWVNAVEFSQRHEQEVIVSKADHLCQGRPIMARRFDPANLSNRRERSFDSITKPVS